MPKPCSWFNHDSPRDFFFPRVTFQQTVCSDLLLLDDDDGDDVHRIFIILVGFF